MYLHVRLLRTPAAHDTLVIPGGSSAPSQIKALSPGPANGWTSGAPCGQRPAHPALSSLRASWWPGRTNIGLDSADAQQ